MGYDLPTRWVRGTGAAALTFALVAAGGATALAQGATPAAERGGVVRPPAAIHVGTCASPTAAPAYGLGDMEVRTYDTYSALDDGDLEVETAPPAVDAVAPEVAPVDLFGPDGDYDRDGVPSAAEEGYIGEDADGDAVLDEGEDRDGDGTLEPEELVERPVAEPIPLSLLRTEAEVDATFDKLFAEPHMVAVHESADEYGTLIACGEITIGGYAYEDEDRVVIPLRPLKGSGYDGYAVFERDTDELPVFGENSTGVTVYLFQGLTTLREERAAGTPAASPAP